MTGASFNSATQLSTVRNAGPGKDRCQFCQLSIAGSYYRVNDAMACISCVENKRTELAADKHAAFVRAVAHGVVAAIFGMIAYAAIAILLQGWVISYMSIGVGWIVGTALMRGSNGVGGRRYQIAAAILTYAAVSMAAIPIWIHFGGQRERHQQTQQEQLAEEQRQLEDESGQPHSARPSAPTPAPTQKALHVNNVLTWLGRVALLGLASPFIQLSNNPLWGGMGLVILLVGIRIAWKIAEGKPFQIFGPFDSSPQTYTRTA